MTELSWVLSLGELVTLRGLEDVSKLPVPPIVPVRSHVTWLRLTLTGTTVSRPQTEAYLSQYIDGAIATVTPGGDAATMVLPLR